MISSNYINETDLMYEVLRSKGKGEMTPELKLMFVKIADRTMLVFKSRYSNYDDYYDVYMDGLVRLYTMWKAFDEKKYDKALGYYTEIFKRGVAESFNRLKSRDRGGDSPTIISINNINL